MRRILLTVLLLVGLFPLSAAARTLLVVGDSLSSAYGMEVQSGWVVLLGMRLKQENLDYRIVNASISGDTTANGLVRLPKLLAQHKPTLVIIELGGNDGLRGLSLEQMKHNISMMVTKAKRPGASVLLVGVQLPPNYGKTYTERFQAIYREIAAEQGVALVPSLLEGIATRNDLMQPDRIHASARAQPRMLENVWAHLRHLLESEPRSVPADRYVGGK
ncbi:MAG: arylesterase [Sulfuricaulis sp.]|uniref:arylesterase n=1 Tax=Sulfuricaulis sp. TaxID=2003553 RepID=UPI0025CEC03E|nr:arylesterase [Sulfuricaulis sp.]MCR4347565.1 arylesterase [Sulfuricaulis sp.]